MISVSMLMGAVAVALAGGVMLAYGVCVGMFRVFQAQSTAVAARRGRSSLAGMGTAIKS